MTESRLACPRKRCNRAHLRDGVLPQCPDCHGVWIPEAVLHARIATQQSSPPRLDWRREARAAVRCLVCTNPMEALCLYDVPIDRCRGHGIWLDGGELEHVLDACTRPRAAATPDSDLAVVGEVGGLALEVGVEATLVAAGGALELAHMAGGAVGTAASAARSLPVDDGGGAFTNLEPGDGALVLEPSAGTGLAEVLDVDASGLADGAGDVAGGLADGAGSAFGVVGEVVGTIAGGTVSVVGSIAEGLIDGLGSILDF